MKNFNRQRGGQGGFKPMHQAICADCGNSCEVPFRPSGDRPVYCSACFGKQEGNDRAPKRDFNRPSFNNFNRGGSNRDRDNRDSRGSNDRGNDEVKRQLEGINNKLDQLARAIDRLASQNKPAEIVPVAMPAKKKAAKAVVGKKVKVKAKKS